MYRSSHASALGQGTWRREDVAEEEGEEEKEEEEGDDDDNEDEEEWRRKSGQCDSPNPRPTRFARERGHKQTSKPQELLF